MNAIEAQLEQYGTDPEDDRKARSVAVRRLIAILFVLAAIAQLSSKLPHQARAFILRVLRPAAPMVWQYIANQTRNGGLRKALRTTHPVCMSTDPSDALDLASEFRLLANTLDYLINNGLIEQDDLDTWLFGDEVGGYREIFAPLDGILAPAAMLLLLAEPFQVSAHARIAALADKWNSS